jgi:hypothetical protein
MKTTRFPTDRKLWAWIALITVAVSWCIPVISIKGGPHFSIATALRELFSAIRQHDDSATKLFSLVFVVFAVGSVLISVVFGWLLHCFLVILRAKKSERT